jgi:hypothetical protein
MTQTQARRRIWERLAATARADIDNADWMLNETEDEADYEKLELACTQVADSIDARLNCKRSPTRRRRIW